MEFAPKKGAVPNAREAARLEAENAHSARRDDVGAGPSSEALPPAAAPQKSGRASAAPGVGAETAPQAIENIDSAPENGRNPAAAGRTDRAPPHAAAFATRGDAPGSGAEHSLETLERPDPVAVALVADSAAPGGFRRVNIRMLPNAMAVCRDGVW